MTDPFDQNNNGPESADELQSLDDRLTDRALCELYGQRPPDLQAGIMARADEQGLFEALETEKSGKEKAMNKKERLNPERLEQRSGSRWGWFATAACVLVVGGGVAVLLMPMTLGVRESARSGGSDYARRQHYTVPPADSSNSEAPELRYDQIVTGEIVPKDSLRPDEGRGPGTSGDQYARIIENPFAKVTDHPLSTFSIDVDTASYANVRSFLLQQRMLPPPDAVRIEELINYFAYDYAGPANDDPFAANLEVAACPWEPKHRLARIAIKGKEIDRSTRPLSNLVFLIDVSGSMRDANKLPLLKQGMKLLAEQLGENDQVAIVVYASAEGLVLPSTNGSESEKIIYALDNLNAGGSTNGGAGIELAYRVAQQNFIRGGVNRVILCTDGDFNVGTTSTAALERLAEEKAKSGVFLTVLGFGRGNLNDAMMETISNKGNGNYAYIDGPTEARKVLVEQMSGTLVTIAKDVKIQVEFNPAEVFAYRLIGYENRVLAAEDFNDDRKDAGEIGAGHTVTALYELVPQPHDGDDPTVATGDVDDLKYQRPGALSDDATSGELLTLKLRYKQPDGDKSRLLQFPLKDDGKKFGQASGDFKFASSVAAFGMLLRGSQFAGNTTIDAVLEIAQSSKGHDKHGYRAEFLEMVREAKRLGK